MYLRRTQRHNRDGSTVYYYQLAENSWDKDKGTSTTRVIYNFGRADQLDPEQLKRLAHSILRFLPAEEALAAEPDVRILDAWPYGGAYTLDHLWQQLGIDRVLRDAMQAHPTSQPLERALFAMVANRALAPYSKLYCHQQWLREEVFLPDAPRLQLHHLYRAMDLLDEHQEAIQKAVYFQMADLMNADVDLLFYDTTSLHFEIDQEDAEVPPQTAVGSPKASAHPIPKASKSPAQGPSEALPSQTPAASAPLTQPPAPAGERGRPLRMRGYSKNGRGDAPQIVVALAVTRDGLPVRVWVFPGNTADVTTVEKVKADLRGWRLGRCVLVGDAGMNSEDNRRKLALGGGKYILGAKMRAGDEVTHQVLTRPGRYSEVAGNLRVKEVCVGDGERRRRYVVCHNPDEAERQREHRDRLLRELEVELETLEPPAADGHHSKRSCELLTSARYGRYLRRDRHGALRIDREKVRQAAHYDGKWVLTSNDDTLTPEDLALGYKQLLRVEQCWCTMKSGLRMRPVYHWTERRIRAHVLLCVLALLLERVAEIRSGDTWRNVASKLETIKVVEYQRAQTRVRQTTEVRGDVQALLNKLRVPMPPKLHLIEPTPSAQSTTTA